MERRRQRQNSRSRRHRKEASTGGNSHHLTGRYLPPNTPTFVQQFRRAGYRTCAVGKTHMEIHAYDSDLCSDGHRALMDAL